MPKLRAWRLRNIAKSNWVLIRLVITVIIIIQPLGDLAVECLPILLNPAWRRAGCLWPVCKFVRVEGEIYFQESRLGHVIIDLNAIESRVRVSLLEVLQQGNFARVRCVQLLKGLFDPPC